MTKDRFLAAQALFLEACDLAPSTRAAWLEERCADDPVLRSQVEALLARDQGTFELEDRAANVRARLEAGFIALADGSIPTIDGYALEERVGEGGMGIVYRAQQRRPGRTVALKVIRGAVLSEGILRRFDREAELLARLQHRGIAQVFEVGSFEAGGTMLPFLAMEWIDGVDLVHHANASDLSVLERIELMARVSDAVDHAHRRGVLHRDLKPANVLVALDDDGGQPKILDFGIARATDSTDVATLQTREGEIIGTLGYMSPEQLAGDSTKLDARCDVYALGVMAFELLGGTLPIDVSGLSVLRAADVIRTREPTTLRSVHPQLDVDIETVVMCCLEKEPERRYQSAAALADDLRNLLAHRPIHARPPSRLYQLRKFARRNRAMVAGLAGVGLALLIGLVATWIGLHAVQAEQARFESLATVRRFAKLREGVTALQPAWPNRSPELSAWSTRWQELEASMAGIDQTIASLQSRATVSTAERARIVRAIERATAAQAAKVRALERAAAVRAGTKAPEPPDWTAAERIAEELHARHPGEPVAKHLVRRAQGWAGLRRTEFGREQEALGFAEVALQRSPTWLAAHELKSLALHALGRDEEALASAEQMLAQTPRDRIYYFKSSREWLRRSIERARSPLGALQLHDARSERTASRFMARARIGPELENQSDQFLLDALLKLRADVERFRPTARTVEARSRWARNVMAWTIERYRDRWEGARRALAAPNGTNASLLYAPAEIDLQPQVGLIPLGKNPATGLWEFYHLRSAVDPRLREDPAALQLPIPDPQTGAIDVTDASGIVFVLVPGGRFEMGVEHRDKDHPRYDPRASADERGVHEVELDPFFIARHELTQSQWIRLGDGSNPSRYALGQYDLGPKKVVDGSHPVERVSWSVGKRVLGQHGLQLPTEAQWDYAAHAGLDSPWSSPKGLAGLRNQINVVDETAKRYVPSWSGAAKGWDDGYVAHAPVDRFPPNAFGLHHVHGNVFELCQDQFVPYGKPTRRGDGLRHFYSDPQHQPAQVIRGGGFADGLKFATANSREPITPDETDHATGLRPARALLRIPPAEQMPLVFGD